jgi:hypothetical protein
MNLDEVNSILYLKPEQALSTEDFLQISSVLDSYFKDRAQLRGLVIETKNFPGWENFDAFIAHVKFIRKHNARIQRIALVTDSKFADFAKSFIGLFVKSQIKHFYYDQASFATKWILQ